jgi:hypothetical protein
MPTEPAQPHTMNQVSTDAITGVTRWECPTCGRRLQFGGPPHYRKKVLAQGDQRAAHAGGAAGLTIAARVAHGLRPSNGAHHAA